VAEILDVQISSLTMGGDGLGRVDGQVIFVPRTVPGDRVSCRVVQRKKSYLRAEPLDILAASDERIPPQCPLFGHCGGCNWQMLAYPRQLHWKETLFRQALHRVAPQVLLRESCGSPHPWHYRTRVQLKCRMTDHGFLVGFYRSNSHFVVDCQQCPVLHPALQACLPLLREKLGESPLGRLVSQIDLAVDDYDQTRAVIHCQRKPSQPRMALLREIAVALDMALFLQCGRNPQLLNVCGEPALTICVDDPPLNLCYGPGGFAQINLVQNRALVAEVVSLAALSGRERVLDLYCGMGNFSLPLARYAAHVTGVEDFAPSIAYAQSNSKRLQLQNVDFEAASAAGALSRHGGDGVDLLVLDPPRSGAAELTDAMVQFRIRQIIYISCDPATLMRDLKPLLVAGYTIESSRVFDLFPQTAHMESVTSLVLG